MKCEHGNEITVIIKQSSPPYWDDGIETVNRKGEVGMDKEYIKVTCSKCKIVKFVIIGEKHGSDYH